MNILKPILAGLIVILLAGCATRDPLKRKPDKPWYMPDVDGEDRAFFYDPFFGRGN